MGYPGTTDVVKCNRTACEYHCSTLTVDYAAKFLFTVESAISEMPSAEKTFYYIEKLSNSCSSGPL